MRQDLKNADLVDCEFLLEGYGQARLAAGIILRIIRDEELYKDQGFETLGQYCLARWGFGKSRASQLINGAEVVERVNNCKRFDQLPANEAQVRSLVSLPEDQQIGAWKQVVDEAPDGKVTAKHVKDTVKKFLKVGDGGSDGNTSASENTGGDTKNSRDPIDVVLNQYRRPTEFDSDSAHPLPHQSHTFFGIPRKRPNYGARGGGASGPAVSVASRARTGGVARGSATIQSPLLSGSL